MSGVRHDYRASPGLWTLAWRRLLGDRVAMISLAVVGVFLLLTGAAGLGLIATHWNEEVAIGYARPSLFGAAETTPEEPVSPDGGAPASAADAYPGTVKDPLGGEIAELRAALGRPGAAAPAGAVAVAALPETLRARLGNLQVVDPLAKELAEIRTMAGPAVRLSRATTLPLGADKWGHDIVKKTIKGSETSILVGLAAALVATVIGTLLGAVSGYYGGWLDDLLNWFYSIFTAIPYLLLILAIAAVLNQKGVLTIVMIFGLTGWTGIYRLVRAEYMKHRSREYVQAADAIGASHFRRMFVHIFPNVSHVSLVQLSVHAVGFIKSEVILSFLGFGVPVDQVSWGSMLGEAQNELILGYWWQLAAASLAMAILVTAFSMLTDALRDALDPKIK
jgi:peptide/nickel transport system permease protein